MFVRSGREEMGVIIWCYERLGRMGGDVCEGRVEGLGSEEIRGRCFKGFMKRMV